MSKNRLQTRSGRPNFVTPVLQTRSGNQRPTYHRILSKMLFEPWFILPAKHSSMLQELRHRMQQPDEWQDPEDEDSEPSQPATLNPQLSGYGIALIPIYGIIGKKLSWLETFCGGVDLDCITESLKEADEDSDIHTIILDFDSPGGLYTGLPEAADLIREIAGRKTVISYSETDCCSAAYWLACNAGEFYSTRSSSIGSIGGFIAGIDTSKEWENIGWALELFKSGTNKAMGLDGKPWQDTERKFLQALVDKECAEFYDTVKRGRPNVAPEPIETANFYDGDQAVKMGLVDKNVRDIQQVIDAALAAHYLTAASAL